jgi:hypothetical protein
LRILGSLVLSCSLLCAGCSALIAQSGQDVSKLANKDQVHESFGTPTRSGKADGCEFDEYCTHRQISEPRMACACVALDGYTLGLFELVMFPVVVVKNTWTTFAGQTVRFEYSCYGDVQRVLINDKPMDLGVRLP